MRTLNKLISFKAAIIILISLCSKNLALAQITYSKRVKEIAERVVDMTNIYSPINLKEFEVIYDTPEIYLDSAIKYLGRPSYKELEFNIVSLSMFKLKPEDYLKFLSICFESYFEKKIEDSIMVHVLGGVFGNPYIRDNHSDVRVQALLNRLIENNNTTAYIRIKAIKYRDGKVSKSTEGPGY